MRRRAGLLPVVAALFAALFSGAGVHDVVMAAPTGSFHGSCLSFRDDLWSLNQETADAYLWFDNTVKAYASGSVSEPKAVFWFKHIAKDLDAGDPTNDRLTGLVQRITRTSYSHGVYAWAVTPGPFAWASLKVYMAAGDLDWVVAAIASDENLLDPLEEVKLGAGLLKDGRRSLGKAWNALAELPCTPVPARSK